MHDEIEILEHPHVMEAENVVTAVAGYIRRREMSDDMRTEESASTCDCNLHNSFACQNKVISS